MSDREEITNTRDVLRRFIDGCGRVTTEPLEPVEFTTLGDQANGLRRFVDGTGREWTVADERPDEQSHPARHN